MTGAGRVDARDRRWVEAAARLRHQVPACLAEGTEMVGQCRGSGRLESPFLLRRADGRMLELSHLLYLVAGHLNGRDQLPEVAAMVSAQLHRTVSADNVAYLVEHKLRPLQVLQGPDAYGYRCPVASPTPLLGLHLRAAVVPPSAVRVLTTWLRPLFANTAVAIVLAGLLSVDAWMVLAHRVGLRIQDLVYRPGLLLMVLGLTLLAAGFHELGHATASRYGGAEPGVIGVGIYLIWPVFYNDLNDSYRLSRSGRLRADLGGVYFNVVFILVLAALYGITGFQPLLVVVAVQHLVILQQFLPFVRLDGYYIVSDLAGVPDLFARIRPILANLVPWRMPDSCVTELTPGALLVVTAWVLTTLPLLVACLLLLGASTPDLLKVGWYSLTIQGRALVGAARAGELVPGLVSGLQLLAVTIPFIGLTVTILRGLRRLGRPGRPARSRRSKPPPPWR